MGINTQKSNITAILVCPDCRSKLYAGETRLTCSECGAHYPIINGVPNFVNKSIETTDDSQFQADQMFGGTITARIYNAGKKLISSEYMPKDHVKEFISQIEPGQTAVELGSGNRRLRRDIVTVDLFPFPNVDIVADIIKTPFLIMRSILLFSTLSWNTFLTLLKL